MRRIERVLLNSALGLLALGACALEPPAAPAHVSPGSEADWWRPTPGLTWQWQIGDDEIDLSVEAEVYDVDLYVDQSVIDRLHSLGRHVICYISVGSWEEWRTDAGLFPPELLGNAYEGWPGERWLDIRRIDQLAPIMLARLDLCRAKGFDGVEPDNIDIYQNATGFPLTYADQLEYARWLADESHARGLAIGIKNAPEMVVDFLSFLDFAIVEEAFDQDWAETLLPVIEAGKAVFAAEYTDTGVNFAAACDWAVRHRFSLILKDRELEAWVEVCP